MASTGGWRGGYGDQETEAVAGDNRGEFINDIVSQFTVGRMPIDDSLERWIHDELFVDEREWSEAVRDGRLDLRLTEQILEEALEQAAKLADRVGEPILTLSLAEDAFETVFHGHDCPYPLKEKWC